MLTLTTPYNRPAYSRFSLFTLLGTAKPTPVPVNPEELPLSEEIVLPEWDKKLHYFDFDLVETEDLQKVDFLNDLTPEGNFFFGRIACLSTPCIIKAQLKLQPEEFFKSDFVYEYEFPYPVQSVEKADSDNLVFLPGGHHNLSFSNNTVVIEGTSHCSINPNKELALDFTVDSEDFSYQNVKVLDFKDQEVDYVEDIEYGGNRYYLSSRLLTKSFLYNSKLKQALLVPPVVTPRVIEIIRNPNTFSIATWYPDGGTGGTRTVPAGLVTYSGFTGSELVSGISISPGTPTINQLQAGGQTWTPVSPIWQAFTYNVVVSGAPRTYQFTIHRKPVVSVFNFTTSSFISGGQFKVFRTSSLGAPVASSNLYGLITAPTLGESTSLARIELVSSVYLKLVKSPDYVTPLTSVALNDVLSTSPTTGVRLVYTGPGSGYSQPTSGSVSFRIYDSRDPSLFSPTYTATIPLV